MGSLTWLHLQRSYFQIRSYAQIQGIRSSMYHFGVHNSTHYRRHHTPKQSMWVSLPTPAPWEVARSLPFPPMPSAFIHHTFPEHPHVLPTNAETGGNGDKKILALTELAFWRGAQRQTINAYKERRLFLTTANGMHDKGKTSNSHGGKSRSS